VNASRLMKEPRVLEAIVAGQARIAKKAEMNAERVLALLATRLNVPMPNLKDLFDGNNLKPMADLTVHRPLESYELR